MRPPCGCSRPRSGARGRAAPRQSNVQLEGRELRLACSWAPLVAPHLPGAGGRDPAQAPHLLAEIGADLIVIGIGLALLMAAAVWWAIRQGLQPVTALSLELEQRDLHRLKATGLGPCPRS